MCRQSSRSVIITGLHVDGNNPGPFSPRKSNVSIVSAPRLFPEMEYLGSATDFVDEIHDIVKSMALFGGFSKQECEVLCEYMECYGAPSKTTILNEGDQGDFLIIVLTGQINVVKADDAATSKEVAQFGPGGLLGEMSLFDGQPRFASCIATQPTDFAVLARDSINDLLIDHPRLCNKLLLILLQVMAVRLRVTTTRMLPGISGVSI